MLDASCSFVCYFFYPFLPKAIKVIILAVEIFKDLLGGHPLALVE